MTRINLIPAEELSDQHLLAELRELPRIFTLADKSPQTDNIPKTFCLGTGHMNFFKDKLASLCIRYIELYHEWVHLRDKNYKYDLSDTLQIMEDVMQRHPHLDNVWVPTDNEVEISRQRIQEKIDAKPDLYTWSRDISIPSHITSTPAAHKMYEKSTYSTTKGHTQ